MADHAISDDAAVQTALDRLTALSPGRDILGLERIDVLLDRLGNPHHRLPPVFHVAGTNGKGSTCAFLRAMLEAEGYAVHAYTSPHLVRFNERIRLAGHLIDDALLAATLERVMDAGEDLSASFFEVTTAAALLLFAETPADACVIEVGLGGRLDATNVIAQPLVCGIAALGIDHEGFLLAPEDGTPDAPLERIAFEKAGIAKRGVPLVTMEYPASMAATIAEAALRVGAPVEAQGSGWTIESTGERSLLYSDRHGDLALPRPGMVGDHQIENAGLAVAMLRQQEKLPVSPAAMASGVRLTRWPARMQKLPQGALTQRLPSGSTLWLDGGHNPNAGAAIAETLAALDMADVHLIIGMLLNKDAAGFIAPFASRLTSLSAVPISGHDHHDPADLCAIAQAEFGIAHCTSAPTVSDALARIIADHPGDHPAGQPLHILIAGSLYLAGEVLKANGTLPD
jgi:dihydrofolate synthase/folylpolyglutamate synthase